MAKLNIRRYDATLDKSLQAWSAADEYLLQYFTELEKKSPIIGIYNDRFGYLTCHLHGNATTTILTQKSQEKAILANLKKNNLPAVRLQNPLAKVDQELDLALFKIPKSLDLFQLMLHHLSENSTEDILVVCGFMTRHFSPKMLDIAQLYFDVVEQSKAQKKARLLILSKKKAPPILELTTAISYNNHDYHQYRGVFSAQHIDYATQYFLEHLDIKDSDISDLTILDLASGNGIIGKEVSRLHPSAHIHLMDDAFLAVQSSKLNISGPNIHHHWNDSMSVFANETFDVILTNPPFHFEHEVNIQVTLQLFKDCVRCLKRGGNLQIVANKHLNYKTHLEPLFSLVTLVAENDKFVVYMCSN